MENLNLKPTGNDTISVDYRDELLDNYLLGDTIDGGKEIKSLIYRSDSPMFFLIDKEHRLNLIINDSSSGWVSYKLSPSGMDVTSFDIHHDSKNNNLRIVYAVIYQNQSKLFVSNNISLTSINPKQFESNLSWEAQVIDDTSRIIDQISINNESILCTNVHQKTDVKYTYFRYGETAKSFTLPENIEKVIQLKVGKIYNESGVFVLYKMKNENTMLFQSFPDLEYNMVSSYRFRLNNNINAFSLLDNKEGNSALYLAGDGLFKFENPDSDIEVISKSKENVEYSKIIKRYWQGLPDNMDIALNNATSENEQCLYFFKEDTFYKYNFNSNELVSSGYIYENWAGLDVENEAYSKKSWMGDLFDELKSKTLLELTLPGTHDSGTNALTYKIAPDADDMIKKIWKMNASGLKSYITGMATAQSLSIKEQLEKGIRYIDLRVCIMDKDFYTCHSLQGSKISEILTDVNSFLEQNKKEIVVFKIGYKGKLSESNQKEFKQLFGNKLKEHYSSTYDKVKDKTIEKLIKDKQRVLFLEDQSIEGIYDEKATSNESVLNLLKEKTREFKDKNKFLEAQLFRPISNQDFVLGAMKNEGCEFLIRFGKGIADDYLGKEHILANYNGCATSLATNASNSRSIIKDYCEWVAINNQIDNPNMIICDYFHEVPFVDIAISMSRNQSYSKLLMYTQSLKNTSLPQSSESAFKCMINLLAILYKAAGYLAKEVAKLLNDGLKVGDKVVAEALQQAGYAVKEVGEALKYVYNLGDKVAAEVLKQAGYAVKDVGEVLQDVYNLGDKATAETLKQAGYAVKEIKHLWDKILPI